MNEHNRTIFWGIASLGLVALLAAVYVCTLGQHHNGADPGTHRAAQNVERGALRLRTVHGTVDLSNVSLAKPVTGIPESLVNIQSKVDDQGYVRKLVQFQGPIKPENRSAIVAAGAEILGYLPDNILVVKTPEDRVEKLESLDNVHAVTDRPTWISLQPNLLGVLDKLADVEEKEGLDEAFGLLVQGDSSVATLEKELAKAGLNVNSGRSDFAKIFGSIEQLKDYVPVIMTVPSVSYIQVYRPKRFADSPEDEGVVSTPQLPILYNNNSSGIVQTGELENTAIWDRGLTGEGQVVMICDSGTDPDHQMFSDPDASLPPTETAPYDGVTTFPTDRTRRKIILYVNAHGQSTEWDELMGHGTHVAGTAVGSFEDELVFSDIYGHNGLVESNVDGTLYKGMAPGAQLVVSDIGLSDGSLAVNKISDYWGPGPAVGAGICNNSWGVSTFIFGLIRYDYTSYTAEQAASDAYLYKNPGFLVVRAAGNDGDADTEKTIGFEAETKNELSVGALGDGSYDGTGLDQRAYFSSEGPTADGRFRPHIMAPGNMVVSAYGDGAVSGLSDDLALMPGTSMASPTVAGSVALIRQYFTDGYYIDTFTPSSALLRAMVINSGTDLYDGSNATVESNIPNSTQGWGRLTLDNVLAFEDEVRQLKVWDDAGPVTTGETLEFEVEVVDASEELRITLAWTDPAGTAGAEIPIVNDLDLFVVSPATKRFAGNNFFEGQSYGDEVKDSDGEKFRDAINTEECVYIKEPEVGVYKITVTGFNVPGNSEADSDKQAFSLVVTGGIPRPSGTSASKDQSAGSSCTINTHGGSIVTLLPLLLICGIIVIRRKQAC